ncbi:MAG: hypothetical protein DRP06_01800 [Candidatus Aenigmatarchaeota archaeon]|nr:MAG: hypothetical protein DRP06_01800 [Candidatus Aenigmarchaeota archaeon]
MVFNIYVLLNWLIPSILAAIGMMLSSNIIKHNLEFKHAIIIALAANIVPSIAFMFLNSYFIGIPFGFVLLDLLCWIALTFLIMSDIEVIDRIKIAILGFGITQVLLFVLPWILELI